MDVPLQFGRALDARDSEREPGVAIVNQALAKKYFPHENPIGKRIKLPELKGEAPWLTIVGVVADEKGQDFFHAMSWQDRPTVYRPVSQDPPPGMYLVFRTQSGSGDLANTIQKEIAGLDANVPIGEVQTMRSRVSHLLGYPTLRAIILAAFAGLALLLAGIGLYAVLSQLISQRTREFGVRMALGAERRDLVILVLREGMMLALAGIAAGLALTASLTGLLRSLLYGVKPADPWTLGSVSLLIVSVALLATYIPSRRASRVDPMVALRYE